MLTKKEINEIASLVAEKVLSIKSDEWISEDEAVKLTGLQPRKLREKAAEIPGSSRCRKTTKEVSSDQKQVRRGFQYNKPKLEENFFKVI